MIERVRPRRVARVAGTAAIAEAGAPRGTTPLPGTVAPDALQPQAADERLKALIGANRGRVDVLRQLRADAALGDPAAAAAFQARSQDLLDWLEAERRRPEHAGYGEFFRSWLAAAAELWLVARPLPAAAERQARYAELDAAFRASRSERDRALLAAAAKELAAAQPRLATSTPSAEVRAALRPAIGHLARSADPVARELARRIEAGELRFKISNGGHLGVQYYAMVALAGITLSNGEVGPDFFQLSPPFQAAVLRHEFTHVVQKAGVAGWAKVLAGNLVQRLLGLVGLIPGIDQERLERLGRRWNTAEQEAYRAQKAFLAELGWADRGLLIPDLGMLEGIEAWLEASG